MRVIDSLDPTAHRRQPGGPELDFRAVDIVGDRRRLVARRGRRRRRRVPPGGQGRPRRRLRRRHRLRRRATTPAPRCCSKRCGAAASPVGWSWPAAWSSTARGSPAARRTASVRPAPRPADRPRRRPVRAALPACRRAGRGLAWVPVDESAPADPRNVYAATKLHQEHLCGLWGRAAGATRRGAALPQRLRTADAPRHALRRCGVDLPQRAGRGTGARAVFEDGGQTRDFVHVARRRPGQRAGLTAAGRLGRLQRRQRHARTRCSTWPWR